MMARMLRTEWKWMLLVVAVAGSMATTIYLSYDGATPGPIFELSLVFEMLVFLVFSIFVVFGIKGFFERFSQKFANVVIFISGVILTVVIFILSYQILFKV